MVDSRKAIQQASEAAEEAPEDLRQIAFRTVLEHILQGASPDVPVRNESVAKDGTTVKQGSTLAEWAKAVVAGLPEAHLIRDKGNRTQQALWATVTLYGRGIEVTSEEIGKLIRTELGIAPEKDANTARTVRTKLTPKYVTRRERRDGRGFCYEPTARALDGFEGL